MAMVFCRECGKKVSEKAKTCPSCGAPQRAVRKAHFVLAVILSVLVGWLGIDRFYFGHIWLGILKLITLGGLGVWWLVDIILVATKNVNGVAFEE